MDYTRYFPNRDTSDWQYVTVPEKDEIFDRVHPTIRINKMKFPPGTHFVPPEVAGELQRILLTYRLSQIRILQPKKDLSALRKMQERGYAPDMSENPS